MKRCPQCHRTFQDASLRFCLFDGTELVADGPQAPPSQQAPQQPQGGYVQSPYVQPPSVQSPSVQSPPQGGYVPPQYGPRPNKGSGLVAAVIVVLLLLGGVGWNLVQRLRPAVVGGGSGAASVSPDELIAAIKVADQAEVDARARLDSALLEGKFIGKQLDREKSDLQAYQSQGIISEGKLTSQQFGKMVVSKDGTRAAVQVTETWDVTEYSAQTRQVLKTIPGSVAPQTVLLVRGPNGWVVSDIANGLQSLDGGRQ